MKKFRKLLSVLIAVLMLICALPVTSAGAIGEYAITTDAPYEMTIGQKEEKVKFTPDKDGWYRFYTTGGCDTYATLSNSLGMELAYADDANRDTNFSLKYELSAGRTYYLSVGAYTYGDEESTFSLYVEETVGIESITITKEPDNPTAVKDFEYQTAFCDGMEAEFNMSDGTTQFWSFDQNSLIDGEYVSTDFNTDLLGRFYVEISCQNVSTKFYFTIIDNIIDRIEYSGSAIEIYENSNGYFDEELGFYHYNYDFPEDASVTVYYTDGTSESGSVYDKFKGGYVDFYDEQYITPWSTESDNFVTLSILEAEAQIPVHILPCPFKSVTLNSAPTKQYIFGDSKWGYMYEGGYELYPEDLSGISFTVEYEDGTKKTYTDKDFDTYEYILDGYYYNIDYVYAESAGTYETTLYYKGYELTYDIQIIESPVAELEILCDPVKTHYNGNYYPIFDGMQIKVTYTDNTSETITLSSENTNYIYDGLFSYEIPTSKAVITAYYNSDEELGEHYIFNCYGTEAIYTGCTFDYNTNIDIEVEKLTENIDGTIVHVTYSDGTEKTFNLKKLASYDYDEYFTEGVVMTEDGIAYYDIEKLYEGDELTGYDFYFLGNQIEVEATEPSNSGILGDVNEDGEVNIKDATAIQKYIAQLEALSDTALTLADTDSDTDVNIKDATAIQKHIAGINTGYPIGDAVN
ncbi:MAG: dockerin type I repeat-containing protein [Ruminococcus sp.]|nr:dockerin type I repeat-containing protein [Ruminococcus sp.]